MEGLKAPSTMRQWWGSRIGAAGVGWLIGSPMAAGVFGAAWLAEMVSPARALVSLVALVGIGFTLVGVGLFLDNRK